MPTIPCQHWVCGCPDGAVPDWPILNLSAEAPDVPVNLSRDFPPIIPPPIGDPYGALYCGTQWVYSDVSQEAADLAAASLNINCGGNPPPPPPPPDEDGGNPPVGESWGNAAQTCAYECPDGNDFSHTIPANTVFSIVSQADANARALSLCSNQVQSQHLCFNDSELPAGCNNEAYGYQLTMTGGVEPYTFTVDPAELPNGMTFVSGSFFGTPSTAGAYPMTIVVTDSSVPPLVTSKLFTLYLAEITTASPMEAGAVGFAYSETLTQTDAPAGAYWIIYSGALPDGLTLDQLTGTISGTPTTIGDNTFEIALVTL